MENQSSMDHLLMQIGEMLEKIQNHKTPVSEKVTPEMFKEMDKLEQVMSGFNDLHQAAFQEAHVDIDSLKQQTLDSSQTNPRDKQLISRAEVIAYDARTLQLALSKAIERGKGNKRRGKSAKNVDKHQMKERRKLFKPLGGDRNWIPM